MKKYSRGRKPLFLLVIAFCALIGPADAQSFSTLHSLAGIDGRAPHAALILEDYVLYGTVQHAAFPLGGLVFAVLSDGTDFTNLHTFYPGNYGIDTLGSLVLSGNKLYGTGQYGQNGGNVLGTVFAINTDGTGLTNVHVFSDIQGGYQPMAGMVLSGSTLYGTTSRGGTPNYGTIFKVNTDGTGFTNLYSFGGGDGSILYGSPTNEDGAYPQATLVLSGETLYGTAPKGGTQTCGAVFSLKTDGTAFSTLHNFTGGSDGASPTGKLLLSGNTLFGTTQFGGSSSNGTIFKLNINGSGFTTLYSFSANENGGNPQAGLILLGNTLYGTTFYGGSWARGTIFSINTDGTDFAVLHHFTGGQDGGNSCAELLLSGNDLYGTTSMGGTSGQGTIFRLSLLPELNISEQGRKLILTWTTNLSGFTLQSSPDLLHPNWDSVSSTPVIVNGRFVVTNEISAAQQFFRLRISPSTTVKLLTPRDGAALQAGDMQLLAKAASDPFNTISSVTFLSLTNILGVVTNLPYSVVWSNVPAGTYALQAIAENTSGVRATSLVATVTASVFLQNGGFETGDFTGWTLVGTPNPPNGGTYNGVLSPASGVSVIHSGNYGCALADVKPAYLSQTFWTVPAQHYQLSFWLDNPAAGTNQAFSVSWNSQGVTNQLLNIVNPPAFSWTNYQFVVTGSGSDTTILIQAENDPGYFGLDDISLTPVP